MVQEAALSFEEALYIIRCEMVSLLRTEANVQARDIDVSLYIVDVANQRATAAQLLQNMVLHCLYLLLLDSVRHK